MKDDDLNELSQEYNIAQFVSFGPGSNPDQRYLHVADAVHPPSGLDAAIELVLQRSAGAVNVRSFLPERPNGNPFEYNLTSILDVAAAIRSFATAGYYTIVNETIDVADGGVSGVVMGDVMEFAPLDTPRAVEKPGVAALPRNVAARLLSKVYGFAPRTPDPNRRRIEFSIHPLRVGVRREHTLVWEVSPGSVAIRPQISWPNNFSRFLGDKAYGLLVADAIGLPVPQATVVGRNIAPFKFGRSVGTGEIWIRTCPIEPVSGHYTTRKGWVDPYRLLSTEDPSGSILVSVLAQESVSASFSGATSPVAGATDLVEGVAGHGDRFMSGYEGPARLPDSVVDDVRTTIHEARAYIGPVRMEWAHDGAHVWILQLHVGRESISQGILSPGEPANGWVKFNPAEGITTLESLIERANANQFGIILTDPVGYTSHIGEVLRAAGVPARLTAD